MPKEARDNRPPTGLKSEVHQRSADSAPAIQLPGPVTSHWSWWLNHHPLQQTNDPEEQNQYDAEQSEYAKNYAEYEKKYVEYANKYAEHASNTHNAE